MRQALRMAAIAVVLLAALIAAPSILDGGASVTRAEPDFSLEVDTEPTGNTGDAVGPTEFCRQVSVGQSLTVDVVTKDAPGLFGIEVGILYDPQVLQITGIQVDSGLFLGKVPGSNVVNFSRSYSDDHYRAQGFDLNNTRPSGNGTVFRLTLETKVSGISPFEFALDDPTTFFFEGPVIPDPNQPTGQPGLTPLLRGGEIRVGQQAACPGSAPPSTEPTLTPTPASPGDGGLEPTATPTPTPGTPNTKLLADVGARDSELVVGDGEVFLPGDIIQVGEEKMRVISASSNLLQVERGVEGTEATEHRGGATVVKVDDEAEESTPRAGTTGAGGVDSGGGSGTDLTGMPWLAVWATLGGLAIAGGGGALIRLRLRRMR